MQTSTISIPLPGPHNNPKKYLRHYGFQPPSRVQMENLLLAITPVFAILFGVFLHQRFNDIDLKGTDVALAVTALGALLLGYQQWREARHEISMDKYYERLEIANDRREKSPLSHEITRHTMPELANEDPDLMMYVYAELDNLEYVVGKYRLGYMKHWQACRGLRTFQKRCLSKRFRNLAYLRVHGGDYDSSTVNVVEKIIGVLYKLESAPETRVVAQEPIMSALAPSSYRTTPLLPEFLKVLAILLALIFGYRRAAAMISGSVPHHG